MTNTLSPRKWEDKGTFEGGSSMGDGQVSDDVTRQWISQRPDGTWDVFELSLAVVDDSDDDNVEGAEYRYYVDERWEYIHCTDPEDPGSAELDTTIEYGEGSYRFYGSADEARRLVKLPSADQFRVTDEQS